MTVLVCCNLPDGIVLGTDSSITFKAYDNDEDQDDNDEKGSESLHSYDNCSKIYRLGNKSIGIAFFGCTHLGWRSIESYIKEFETISTTLESDELEMVNVVSELREYFERIHEDTIIATEKKKTGLERDDIVFLNGSDIELGLIIAGFSNKSYLSEIWKILLPKRKEINSQVLLFKQGEFGVDTCAMAGPISRYRYGYSPNLLKHYEEWLLKQKSLSLEESDRERIRKEVLDHYKYEPHFDAMSIKTGIEYTKFLVELAINHYKYSKASTVVGGDVQLGFAVKGEPFRILDN
jgi:hypothetical protein